MARDLAQCGTPAAYRRHNRRGELVDEACRLAARAEEAARRRRSSVDGEGLGAVVRLRPEVVAVVSPEVRAVARERLLAGLERLERAMDAVSPGELVPLCVRHSEVVADLVALGEEVA